MKTGKSLQPLGNERGMVLVVAILILAVLVLLGTTAVMTTTTDLRISRNYKTGEQAFAAAEAGVEEARARLRGNYTPTTGATGRIADSAPTSTTWTECIGSTGCNYTSIQSALTYTVTIRHQTSGGSVLYWGDTNDDGIYERSTTSGASMNNIYLVTSTGTAAGASKTITAEVTRTPPISVPAALYVEAPTTVQGTSTNIIGTDQCGGTSKPGIVSTLGAGTVSSSGNPKVCGGTYVFGSTCTNGGPMDVVGSGTNRDIDALVAEWKPYANYTYNVTSATHTGMTWGVPIPGATQQNPTTCDASSLSNIIYYNTNATEIKLSGGTMGCGILLVDGDLDLNGSFMWHGLVIVTGSVWYTGGGDKNVTGAVLAGGSLDADLIGGNANIVYCSTAISNLMQSRAMRALSWKDDNI